MIKVTTLQEAVALPEVKDVFLECNMTVNEDGHTTRHFTPRPFMPSPIDGDQILIFADKDGRLMRIIYTEDGPAKTEFV